MATRTNRTKFWSGRRQKKIIKERVVIVSICYKVQVKGIEVIEAIDINDFQEFIDKELSDNVICNSKQFWIEVLAPREIIYHGWVYSTNKNKD